MTVFTLQILAVSRPPEWAVNGGLLTALFLAVGYAVSWAAARAEQERCASEFPVERVALVAVCTQPAGHPGHHHDRVTATSWATTVVTCGSCGTGRYRVEDCSVVGTCTSCRTRLRVDQFRLDRDQYLVLTGGYVQVAVSVD